MIRINRTRFIEWMATLKHVDPQNIGWYNGIKWVFAGREGNEYHFNFYKISSTSTMEIGGSFYDGDDGDKTDLKEMPIIMIKDLQQKRKHWR